MSDITSSESITNNEPTSSQTKVLLFSPHRESVEEPDEKDNLIKKLSLELVQEGPAHTVTLLITERVRADYFVSEKDRRELEAENEACVEWVAELQNEKKALKEIRPKQRNFSSESSFSSTAGAEQSIEK
jgi:hypothetical protein